MRDHSTLVLDAQGGLLQAFPAAGDVMRVPTGLEQVDPLYPAMLKAAEDRRFGLHPGFDPFAALRATGQALRYGRVVSGASTLSMQVARLLEPKPRTLGAKLTEILRAVQVQAHLGRDGILAAYMTLAPFGGALEGVQAASWAWFGKPPTHLSPAEAALLAALPQSPERLRPDRFPAAARAARDRILDRAAAAGVINTATAQAAKADPVPVDQRPLPMHAPHLARRLAAAAPVGAILRTHVDGKLQRGLERLGLTQKQRFADDADLAVVVLANQDRKLLAHLGSGDWLARQVDLSQARRSPGSTLKPFIYAVAFDDLSLHPGSLISDMPQRFGAWRPRNFDHDFHGTVTAREALQRSLNIPAVQVLEKIGPARFAAVVRLCGIDLSFPSTEDPGLPLALGGVGIRLTDLAALYAGLADDGRILPPATLQGEPPPSPRVLVGSAAARAVLDVLEGSPSPNGIASGSGVARPRRIAFKTGTSFGFRDAWTVGVSADYTVAVWVGRADGAPRPGAMGRETAAPIMFKVFDLLPPDHGLRPPPQSPGHALFQAVPPPALAHLRQDHSLPGRPGEPLRILFPPDGAVVETLKDGVSLLAAGGTPPFQWVVDGDPLPAGASFWPPQGEGFSRIVVVDSHGRRAETSIRVQMPDN
nr:penicillin-binding protein 1C [Magnetospirillum sulfuroxidans]